VRAKVATLGFFNFGLYFALLFVAAYALPGGVAAVVMSIGPLLVVVLSRLLLGVRPSFAVLVAATVGTVGVGLVALQGGGAYNPVGLLAALCSAFSVAMAVVLQKRWAIVAPAALMAGWQLTIGGFALLPLTLLVEGVPSRLTAANVAGIVYLACLGTGVAYTLWFRGIRVLGPQLVTFISLLSPVVAVLAGILLLRQSVDIRQAFGIGLVIAAVMTGAFSLGPA